jgi:hypothetical protein
MVSTKISIEIYIKIPIKCDSIFLDNEKIHNSDQYPILIQAEG